MSCQCIRQQGLLSLCEEYRTNSIQAIATDRLRAQLHAANERAERLAFERSNLLQSQSHEEAVRGDLMRERDFQRARAEAAEARCRELEAERNEIVKSVAAQRLDGYRELAKRAEQAEAERDRLREALEELLYRVTHDGGWIADPVTDMGIAINHARAALSPDDTKEGAK